MISCCVHLQRSWCWVGGGLAGLAAIASITVSLETSRAASTAAPAAQKLNERPSSFRPGDPRGAAAGRMLWAAAAAAALVALRPVWIALAPHLRRLQHSKHAHGHALSDLRHRPGPPWRCSSFDPTSLPMTSSTLARSPGRGSVHRRRLFSQPSSWLLFSLADAVSSGFGWNRWWTATAIGLVIAANWAYLIATE